MDSKRVRWTQAWRVIGSRYPPIDLFERVSPDPTVWEALIALEQLTNPRVRDEVGAIALVAPADRISGPGASYVMASFTHLNPRGSRFSDGSYGVYYAADALLTAVAETIHHFERFAIDAGDPPRAEDMRVLVGRVDAIFDDVAGLPPAKRDPLLDPGDYAPSRVFAAGRRAAGSLGLIYPSVRRAGGACIAAFKPTAVHPPVQERHVQYRWNGTRVDRWFDYRDDTWNDWPPAPPSV